MCFAQIERSSNHMKITAKDLTEYIGLSIDKNDTSYIPAPQLYPPLYNKLYDSLLKGEEPEILFNQKLSELPDHVIESIQECSNSFDRYLIACFLSPFELSHPMPIPDDKLNEKELHNFLHERYGKASNEKETIKVSRLRNDVLELFPKEFKKKIWPEDINENNKYKSSIYKLITLNYKLSLINRHWKNHLRRSSQENKKNYHMETIIDQNRLDIEKSRESSALFWTVYYELDQSTEDGDDQESKNIRALTTAYESLALQIEEKIVSTENTTRGLVETYGLFNYKASQINYKLQYSDPHHEFCDTLKTTMLSNRYYNLLLSRKDFEKYIFNQESINNSLKKLISSNINELLDHNESDFITLTKVEIPEIQNVAFDGDVSEIAEVLTTILKRRIRNQKHQTYRNLCLLFTMMCKGNIFPTIKGSFIGNNKPYSLWKSLLSGLKRSKEAPKTDWMNEKYFRPSSLHILFSISKALIWKENKKISTIHEYIKLTAEIYDCTISIFDRIENLNHKEIIRISGINMYEFHDNNGSNLSTPESMRSLLKRSELRWPIEDLKERAKIINKIFDGMNDTEIKELFLSQLH
jgi:hypothetical protein